jgi:hypothetical protein
MKPSWCTPIHGRLSNGIKSVARSTIVWEISTWQTKQINNLHKYMWGPMTNCFFDKCPIVARSTMFIAFKLTNKVSMLLHIIDDNQNWHKFGMLIYFHNFFESYNIKTKFHDYLDFPWNHFHFSWSYNVKFNLHLFETLKSIVLQLNHETHEIILIFKRIFEED